MDGCYLAGAAYGREVFPATDGGSWPPTCQTGTACAIRALHAVAWRSMGCGVFWNIEYRMSAKRGECRLATDGIRFALTMTFYSAGMFVLGSTRGDAVPLLGAWRLDK